MNKSELENGREVFSVEGWQQRMSIRKNIYGITNALKLTDKKV
jgi:hypothetical protein